jgi:hypothetical protein
VKLLVYVGSSAAISFLRFVRKVMRHYAGPSAFTESQTRHTMFEEAVQEPVYGKFEDVLSHSAKVALVNCFLAEVSSSPFC